MNNRRTLRNQQQALENQQTGTYGSGGEIFDYTHYDTAALLSTTLVHHMFTAGLGGGTGRVESQTNNPQGGQFPQGWKLRATSIKVHYAASGQRNTAALQNIYDVFRQSTMSIIISGKANNGLWRVQELIGAPMLMSLVPTVAGNNLQPWSQGIFSGEYHLKKRLTLAALTTYEVLLKHDTAPAAALDGDEIFFGFNGILTRSN